MDIREVWVEFSSMLEKRLNNDLHTSEDSVRYTFFCALVRKGNVEPYELVLERSHPAITRAEIDLYAPPAPSRRGFNAEFKYSRQTPSKGNQPRTHVAGAQIPSEPNVVQYFIYLTDREMATYFNNESNGLVDFFNLKLGETKHFDGAFLEGFVRTFLNAAGDIVPFDVKGVYAAELPKRHFLRVYEIR